MRKCGFSRMGTRGPEEESGLDTRTCLARTPPHTGMSVMGPVRAIREYRDGSGRSL